VVVVVAYPQTVALARAQVMAWATLPVNPPQVARASALA
jgi:hypothetical protein